MANMLHGIVVKNRKTGKIVKFIECPTGERALKILSGMRMNMSSDYSASEDFIESNQAEKLKQVC